jgi:hypothetical protein
MNRRGGLLTTTILLLAASVAAAEEKKMELKSTGWNPRTLRNRFGAYGYRPEECCIPEQNGLRIWLPAEVAEVPQTGFYSHFALAGDCEVIVTYELLNLQPPQKGYGSGVGLAFDAEDKVGRGSIQRVTRPSEGNGYVLQTSLAAGKGKPKEEDRFLPTTATWGRIGLKRVKKNLIILFTDDPTAPLRESDPLPFTDQTIRVLRLFGDMGGAATGLDVRLTDIEVRAEEITDGVPQLQKAESSWWPWVVFPLAGFLLVWRVYQFVFGGAKKDAA